MAPQNDRKRKKIQRLGVEEDEDHDVAMEGVAGPSNTAGKKGNNIKAKSSKKSKNKQIKQVDHHEDNDLEQEDTDPAYEASTEADSDDSSIFFS